MKRWGRYVNPNNRSRPHHRFDGKALWISQHRTPHWKKYVINRTTWYIFIWLCMLESQRHDHHHDTWKETVAGKRRHTERKFKQEMRHGLQEC